MDKVHNKIYVIRKISPWQDQSKFYEIGNPAIGIFRSYEDAINKKNILEAVQLKQNGITNTYEYWDIDCTKELVELNSYLDKIYGIQILTTDSNEEYLELSNIIPTMFPEELSEQDILNVQRKMNRNYYRIEEYDSSNDYIITFNNDTDLSMSIPFKLYKTESEANEDLKNTIGSIYNKESNGSYMLVGPIRKSDFSEKTETLLIKYGEFFYDDENHATRQRIASKKRLEEIENGYEKLIEILESVDKKMFEIKQLK